jgi:hypothetical protein
MRTSLVPLAREIDVWYRRLRRSSPREPQAVEAVRHGLMVQEMMEGLLGSARLGWEVRLG